MQRRLPFPLLSFGPDFSEKDAIFSAETSIYIWKYPVDLFENIVKNLEGHPWGK